MRYLDFFNFVKFDIASLFPKMCLVKPDFWMQLVATTTAPLGISSLILLYAGWLRARKKRWAHLYSLFLFLMYCVFPAVSQTIFLVFSCDSDFEDGQSFLRADYGISCASDTYRAFRAYAVLMIGVYPIGVPLLYAISLYRARNVLGPSKTKTGMLVRGVLQQMRRKKGKHARASSAGRARASTSAAGRARASTFVGRARASSAATGGPPSGRGPPAGHGPSGEATRSRDRAPRTRAETIANERELEHDRLKAMWERYKKLEPDAVEEPVLHQELIISLQELPEFYHKHDVSHLLFLFAPYKPEYYYWEVFESARRLLLGALLSCIFANDPISQIARGSESN